MTTFALWQGPRVRVDCWTDFVDNSGFLPMAKGAIAAPIGDAGEAMEVLSSAIADDGAPGGSGAQTVGIVYLDGTGAIAFESVILNGTGVVTTLAADIAAVLGFFVETTGAGNTNAGKIDLRKVSDAGDRASILAGRNTWSPGQFAVPLGKVATFTGGEFYYGSGSTNQEVRIEADVNPHTGVRVAGQFQTFGQCDTRRAGAIPGLPDFVFPERTVIRARAQGVAGGSPLSGAFFLDVR